jgi:hypothetical protein
VPGDRRRDVSASELDEVGDARIARVAAGALHRDLVDVHRDEPPGRPERREQADLTAPRAEFEDRPLAVM